MTSVTNLVPENVTNFSLTLNYSDGGDNKLLFANDGSFTLDSLPGGTYTYSPFNPGGAMIQITLDTNSFPNSDPLNWLQLNFKTTNSGNFFLNLFDSNTNLANSSKGSFNLK
jgi:hypothetical protein